MKETLRNFAFIAGVLALITFSSCNDDDNTPPKICLETPCGIVDLNATNISLLIQNDINIGNIGIVVDESEQELSLNGLDLASDQPFTCWQTVPTISSSSTVFLGYELDGEVVTGTLNVSGLSSNQLVIKIDGEDAEISDYEACSDIN